MKISFNADERKVRVLGRTKVIDNIRYINYSCSGIEFEFTGKSVTAILCSDFTAREDAYKAWVSVFINDEEVPHKRFPLEKDEDVYTLYESDTVRKVKIKLMKMSEAAFGRVGIKEIVVDGENEITPTAKKERRIEFIGDSITCGYGAEGIWNTDTFNTTQENPWEAYAARTARHFKADFNCVSWSGIGIISSWTDDDEPNTREWLMPDLYKYTDGGLDRNLCNEEYELWDNSLFQPQLIVINLGTNDNSYTKGIAERVELFTKGYYDLLNQVRTANPNADIICALGAMGQDLCPAIKKAVDKFSTDKNDNKLYTFTFDVQLEEDGIGSDWHPSLVTQAKMSKQLIKKVSEVMGW